MTNTDPITTGLPSLDRLLDGGLRPGTLTVIAGQSQSGMTTMLDTIVCAAAFHANEPTVLVDLETEPAARGARLWSALSGVPLSRVLHGGLTDAEVTDLARVADLTGAATFWLSEDRTIPDLDAAVLGVHSSTSGARLLAIDAMRMLSCESPGAAAAALADLAVRRDVAVAATTPLLWNAVGPLPAVDHLPSGVVEAADVVILLRRPDLDGTTDRVGEVEVTVAKHRAGPTGSVVVAARFDRAQLCELVTDPVS
ncbi:DnaB helicase C-terminal domain-containing protein [Micromonospora lupini]|uniref:DnaB-like helicase C-terminal domain-containing protein n=1 Tax=Micromonospora lupini TaxID=285679 RepID=UPI002256863D|nr:DnaB-like helicase C-terminal domain-containing protein [Micromonospora lupini]MCX5066616.1 DnaB helicase C-terminal domain-containing protein [Micromonospora lupini]